jgi:beta-phosphoglucomutase
LNNRAIEQLNNLSFKGVIFDFNGTLFWDTAYHNEAWDIFLERYGMSLTDKEKDHQIHGKNNKDIFKELFGKKINDATAWKLTDEKESIYREICLLKGMSLAPGAEELLDFLTKAGIRVTIATASGNENVKFFFMQFRLDRWFNPEKVVFDDGCIACKPAPDYFLKAAANLGLTPGECAVIEDSTAGILAARAAGVGLIFQIRTLKNAELDFEVKAVRDFSEVMEQLKFL